MFYTLNVISTETLKVFTRMITGRLLTEEQINSATNSLVGQFLKDFFPKPERELQAEKRAENARQHINAASQIISEMQNDLENQSGKLDLLIKEVKDKRDLAERYSLLADVNRETSDALRKELEEAISVQLVEQSEKGRVLRRWIAFSMWIITLVAGAALGHYSPDIINWVKGVDEVVVN